MTRAWMKRGVGEHGIGPGGSVHEWSLSLRAAFEWALPAIVDHGAVDGLIGGWGDANICQM